MNEQLQQICSRIRELREVLDISPQELAQSLEIPLSLYLSYEGGESDIPVGVLYGVAARLGVDPTELLTGEAPRMDSYTVVRGGNGVSVERYEGYLFSSLAFNYIDRDMEPMLVTLLPQNTPELVQHGGQEFNYVLQGTIILHIGGRELTLHAGDSVYFNPKLPHGQRAVGGTARFLTVINEK